MTKFFYKFLSAALFVVVAFSSHAAVFPENGRTITVLVPYAPGGSSDAIARSLTEALAAAMNAANIVVKNVGGQKGEIGLRQVAASPADGYTLLVGPARLLTLAAFGGWESGQDPNFEYLGLIGDSPMVLVGRSDLPVKDSAEIFNWIKANAGRVVIGDGGLGFDGHLCAVQLNKLLNTNTRIVSFAGTNYARGQLEKREFDLMCLEEENALPAVQSGAIKALAVLSDNRSRSLPTVPTFAELGLRDAKTPTVYGLYAPFGTPVDVTDRISGALKTALQSPSFVRTQAAQGLLNIKPGLADAASHRRFISSLLPQFLTPSSRKVTALAGAGASADSLTSGQGSSFASGTTSAEDNRPRGEDAFEDLSTLRVASGASSDSGGEPTKLASRSDAAARQMSDKTIAAKNLANQCIESVKQIQSSSDSPLRMAQRQKQLFEGRCSDFSGASAYVRAADSVIRDQNNAAAQISVANVGQSSADRLACEEKIDKRWVQHLSDSLKAQNDAERFEMQASVGRSYIELFSGSCSSHPSAQNYVAFGNKIVSQSQAKRYLLPHEIGRSAASEGGGPYPKAPPSPPAGAPDYSKRQKIIATSGEPAHQCLSPLKTGLYGGFANSCNFKVTYDYCVYKPKKDGWTDAPFFNCEMDATKPHAGGGVVGPMSADANHTHGGQRVFWFACKSPASPYQIQFNGTQLRGFCKL